MGTAATLGFTYATNTAVTDTPVFLGIHGPFQVHTAGSLVAAGTALGKNNYEDLADFLVTNDAAVAPVYKAKTTATAVPDGSLLLMNGRRYKVKQTAVDTSAGNAVEVTLTETYSGQHFMKLCDDCVVGTAHDGGTVTTITVAATSTFDAQLGDFLMVGSNTEMESGGYVTALYAGADDAGTRAITISHVVGTAASQSSSQRQLPRSRTSTSVSALTAAHATAPPASARASRATPTTTATNRTCLPSKPW